VSEMAGGCGQAVGTQMLDKKQQLCKQIATGYLCIRCCGVWAAPAFIFQLGWGCGSCNLVLGMRWSYACMV
jgi:hypothetical protein